MSVLLLVGAGLPFTAFLAAEPADAHPGVPPAAISTWGSLEGESYMAPGTLCDPNVELQHTQPLSDGYAWGSGLMARLPQSGCSLTWNSLAIPVASQVVRANVRVENPLGASTLVQLEVTADGTLVADQTVMLPSSNTYFFVVDLDTHATVPAGASDIVFSYKVLAGSSPLTDLDLDCLSFTSREGYTPDCQEVPCSDPADPFYTECCIDNAYDPSDCEPCDPTVDPACCPDGADPRNCCPPEGCEPCDPEFDPECCPEGVDPRNCCPPEGCEPCDPAVDPECCPEGVDPRNCEPDCTTDPDTPCCQPGGGYNNADCCGEFGEYCDCDPVAEPGDGCPESLSSRSGVVMATWPVVPAVTGTEPAVGSDAAGPLAFQGPTGATVHLAMWIATPLATPMV